MGERGGGVRVDERETGREGEREREIERERGGCVRKVKVGEREGWGAREEGA